METVIGRRLSDFEAYDGLRFHGARQMNSTMYHAQYVPKDFDFSRYDGASRLKDMAVAKCFQASLSVSNWRGSHIPPAVMRKPAGFDLPSHQTVFAASNVVCTIRNL